jgi:hypothetical protein
MDRMAYDATLVRACAGCACVRGQNTMRPLLISGDEATIHFLAATISSGAPGGLKYRPCAVGAPRRAYCGSGPIVYPWGRPLVALRRSVTRPPPALPSHTHAPAPPPSTPPPTHTPTHPRPQVVRGFQYIKIINQLAKGAPQNAVDEKAGATILDSGQLR